MTRLLKSHLKMIEFINDRIEFANGYHDYLKNGLESKNKANKEFNEFFIKGFNKAQIDFSRGSKNAIHY